MANETEFLFFFFFGPVDWQECSRGWGGGDPGVIGPRRKSRSNTIFCLYSILLYRSFCKIIIVFAKGGDGTNIVYKTTTFTQESKST